MEPWETTMSTTWVPTGTTTTGTTNEISSERPGALSRKATFSRWFSSIVELWRYSVENETRPCLSKAFPGDNPGDLDTVRT